MVQQIRNFIDSRLQVPGSLTFQEYLSEREITRAYYNHVVPDEQILVTIDLTDERHVGHGITTSTNQDLMASLEHLQRRLKRLERSLLTG